MQQDPEFREVFLRKVPSESPSSSSTGDRTSVPAQHSTFLPWTHEALRMIIVGDPIFNITSRAIMCRCIVAEASRRSRAPRIDIPVEIVCPRHAPPCWNAEKDALEMPQRDYSNDPYFEKFGGYGMFRYHAVSTGGPYCAYHLDHEKLIPTYELEHMRQKAFALEAEETVKAARDYEKELYEHSKAWVEKREETGRFGPELLQWARDWHQMLEDTRPDISEPDPDTLGTYKSKSRFTAVNANGLGLDQDF